MSAASNPREIAIDFFMQMAWDVNKWNLKTLPDYLKSFRRATIRPRPCEGNRVTCWPILPARLPAQARAFAVEYQGRAAGRVISLTPTMPMKGRSVTTPTMSSKGRCAVGDLLPESKKDAYYELISYPIQASALANESFIASESAANARPRVMRRVRGLDGDVRPVHRKTRDGDGHIIKRTSPAENGWASCPTTCSRKTDPTAMRRCTCPQE